MKRESKLLLIFSFNATLMAAEVAGGLLSRSLALLSDAGHMLTDSFAVFLSYLAIKWSQKPATPERTFGYHRAEILVALGNGVALLGISVYIFYEAVHRFFYPEEIRTGILLAVAALGLAGNLVGLLILRGESHENLNVRGAFLHILGDTLSSVGVIAGGVIILLTGWNAVDSLIGVLIGGIVLRGAVNLIMEAGEVLLEATPRDIDLQKMKSDVESLPGVREFHEIHAWTITSGRRALSAHILTENLKTRETQKIICGVKELLARDYNITHTTIEAECDRCADNVCEFTSEYTPENVDLHLHHGHSHSHGRTQAKDKGGDRS